MTSGMDHTPARADVVRILRAHGLSGAASAQLWQLSRRMRSATRRRGLEHAAMVDAETGDLVGSIITGQEDAVDLYPHLSMLAPAHCYAQFHAHPGSTSFSDVDAFAFLSWDRITAIVVVGVDGTWYALSRFPGGVASPVAVADAFLIELDRTRASFSDVSLRERTHRVWSRIARDLGPRYDRV